MGATRAHDTAPACMLVRTLHPAVPVCYVVFQLAITMLCMQPVLVGISLAGALATSAATRGWRDALAQLARILPIVAIVCLANPLFSASGSTELLRLGPMTIYAESLAFGACAGAMLAASVLWLGLAGTLVGPGAAISLAGGRLPTVTLMVSMTLRLVPEVIRRGNVIATVRRAWRMSEPASPRDRLAQAAADSGTLMGWTLADSVQTADAMRARGWGADVRRTSWRPYVLGASDVAALAVVAFLGVAALALALVAASQFAFYPRMAQLVVWWGYVPVAAFALLPAAACGAMAARLS